MQAYLTVSNTEALGERDVVRIIGSDGNERMSSMLPVGAGLFVSAVVGGSMTSHEVLDLAHVLTRIALYKAQEEGVSSDES